MSCSGFESRLAHRINFFRIYLIHNLAKLLRVQTSPQNGRYTPGHGHGTRTRKQMWHPRTRKIFQGESYVKYSHRQVHSQLFIFSLERKYVKIRWKYMMASSVAEETMSMLSLQPQHRNRIGVFTSKLSPPCLPMSWTLIICQNQP